MTIGSIPYPMSYAGTPASTIQTAPGPVPAPAGDEVSIGRRIAQAPRQLIEGAAGTIGGAISAVGHVPMGAFEGMSEGLTSERGQGGTGLYTTVLMTESIATGVAVGGVVAGPAGMLVGGGAGLVGGLVVLGLESKADVPQHFVKRVQEKVDGAIAHNTDGSRVKIAVQNATQGTVMGTVIGVQEGWHIGWEAGKGAVSGVLDVAQGVAEGVWEALRGKK